MQRVGSAACVALAALAAISSLAGCRGERTDKRPREFLPDMDDSPKWKPQARSDFFEDGRTMRNKVDGTVAFGETDRVDDPARAHFLKADDVFYTGTTGVDAKGEPVFVDSIPMAGFDGWPREAKAGESAADLAARREAFTGEVIRRGQERFNIYCSVCHGYKGDGQGQVAQRWNTPVANFHDAKYLDKSVFQGKDGYVFNALRYGVPFPNPKNEALRMPGYAHAVNEQDAWAIVAYVRVLQAARINISEAPPTERERLRLNPPAPAAAPAPAPAPAGSKPSGSTTGGATK